MKVSTTLTMATAAPAATGIAAQGASASEPPPARTPPLGSAILPSALGTRPPIPVHSTTFIATLNAGLIEGALAGDRMFGQGGDDTMNGFCGLRLDGRNRRCEARR